MVNKPRIAVTAVGATLLSGIFVPAVSTAADGCGPGMYFNVNTNQCEWNGPVGPGPVGPGPVGPGPVGPGPVGPGPVGPGPLGPPWP